MYKRIASVFAILIASAVSACGGDQILGSCDGTSGGVKICYDYERYDPGVEPLKQGCQAQGQTFSTEPCTADQRVGRCRQTKNSGGLTAVSVLNYYPPMTAGTAMANCQKEGGEWIP
jgi:hypothetical protein